MPPPSVGRGHVHQASEGPASSPYCLQVGPFSSAGLLPSPDHTCSQASVRSVWETAWNGTPPVLVEGINPASAPQATPRPQHHSDPAPFSALHSWGPQAHLFPSGLGPPAIPDTPTSGMFRARSYAGTLPALDMGGGRVTGRRLFLDGGPQAARLAGAGEALVREAAPAQRGGDPALLFCGAPSWSFPSGSAAPGQRVSTLPSLDLGSWPGTTRQDRMGLDPSLLC